MSRKRNQQFQTAAFLELSGKVTPEGSTSLFSPPMIPE
jgi:hypothetical protein